jgi:radical SAM superfamily enzyme YgiQ (UPF0313 family)
MSFPITYDEPLYRPPSEGNSLIIQITLGCSWNKCSFCEMYTSKQFKPRKEEDIFKDIDSFKPYSENITKVFLADGDPLVLSNKRLIPILERINNTFKNLKRISTYASPTNIRKKSNQELVELRNNGLSLLYVGIESGDDQTLSANQKGETFESTIEGINKAHSNNLATSVMIINGVGGKLNWENHARKSADVLNATQPKFASMLVLTMHKGKEHYLNRFKGDFEEMSTLELLYEMRLFFENLKLENTIFRSNHVSNRLVLKGILGEDKQMFLNQIDTIISNPEEYLGREYRTFGF